MLSVYYSQSFLFKLFGISYVFVRMMFCHILLFQCS